MRRRFITKESSVPMYIEALEDDFSFSFNYFGSTVKYRINEGEYNTLTSGETVSNINSGDKVFIYGFITSSYGGSSSFTFNKRCHIGGDIRSLVYGEGYKYINSIGRELRSIFSDNPNLVSVDKKLLSGITQFTEYSSYAYMFVDCVNLSAAPDLPVSVVPVPACYNYMFNGCESLNYIKMLATDVGGTTDFLDWVIGVAPNGTFVKSSKMTSLPIGINGIPEGWTILNDDGSSPFTFTIDGVEYYAEEGMTWSEWCNSSYNVINAVISPVSYVGDLIAVDKGSMSLGYIYDNVSFSYVRPTQEIIVNRSYTLRTPSAEN